METAPTTAEAPLRSPLRDAFVVGGVATVVRLMWVLWAGRPPTGLSDPTIYLEAGASIAEGRGYTSLLGEATAYYPPGYPFFVGGVTRIAVAVGLAEHVPAVLGVVQAFFGGVTAAAVLWLAWRLVQPWGTRSAQVAGVAAGLAVALWPNLVVHSGLVLSETLFLMLYAVLLVGLMEWSSGSHDGRPAPLATVVVVSAALATWVRPQSTLLLVPAVAVAWLAGRLDRRRLMLGVAWLVLGVVVAVGPWTVRNAMVLDAFVPMSTNTGDNLCIGFNDDADGTFDITEQCATDGRYVDGPAVEVARDEELRARAIDWILDHPGDVPQLAVRKLAATFLLDTDGLAAWESYGDDPHLGETRRAVARWVANLAWWALAAGAVAGGVMAARDVRTRVGALVLFAAAATTIVTPALFFGDERFKMPIAPVVAVLFGVAVARALRSREVQGIRSARSDDDSEPTRETPV